MNFAHRKEAGQLLAKALVSYQGQDVVVFALPRGGVVVAQEIASALHAQLDIVLAHKIGHPSQPEYAIAAISEGGHLIENQREVASVDLAWYESEKKQQRAHMLKRRKEYFKGRPSPSVEGRIVILVDDGIATGLTMQAAIVDLKARKPKNIIVAVPVAPQGTAEHIRSMVDQFIGLEVPPDHLFFGSIGAYYADFSQIDDSEVISILAQSEPL